MAAHVNPVAGAPMLEDQLVEVGQVVLHPEPEDAGHLLLGGDGEGPVTVGDLDVGSHAFYMLRVGHAAHKLVEPFTAVAAGHDDGQLEALARGFETAHGEISVNLSLRFMIVFIFCCCDC